MWPGVYLWGALSNDLLQKVPTLVALTATRPELYVVTITIFLCDSYDALEETFILLNNIKLKSYPEENVTDFCTMILIDADHLESVGGLQD